MGIILNIDTAVESASICLAENATPLQSAINHNQKDHAAWLHVAIETIMKEAGLQVSAVDAIAVSIGPGSYTGLRVGLSAAKGLCYALNIPLISVGTLQIIASSIVADDAELICPMIDARRMEVFTAIYDKSLTEIVPAHAKILNQDSFSEYLASKRMMFCGNGSKKLQPLVTNENALFSTKSAMANDMCPISSRYFNEQKFSDIAYTEPLYVKEFFSNKR